MTRVPHWWRSGGADAGLVALTLLPPLLSQASTNTSALVWWLLVGYETVAAVALWLRRTAPVTAFLVIIWTLVAAVVLAAAQGSQLSPLVFLSLAVALYSLGSHCASWFRTGLAALGGAAAVAIGLWVNHLPTGAAAIRGGSDVLAVLAPMPLAWAAGVAVRTHRALLAVTEQRVEDLLREQQLREQQATQQERVRIAREMHDVVAHSLTLLVVRAETLRAQGGELPAWARTQVDGLAVAGRQAGGELRDLLRVLRDPEDAVPLAPMPGLGELPELLERSRAAGMKVDALIEVEVAALPQPVQLAGYRIVQESLTNARRHANGAPVRITIAENGGQLRIEVVNTEAMADGVEWRGGAGLGLVSMRERAEALGGQLAAGPAGDGAFRVVATLPLTTVLLGDVGV